MRRQICGRLGRRAEVCGVGRGAAVIAHCLAGAAEQVWSSGSKSGGAARGVRIAREQDVGVVQQLAATLQEQPWLEWRHWVWWRNEGARLLGKRVAGPIAGARGCTSQSGEVVCCSLRLRDRCEGSQKEWVQ